LTSVERRVGTPGSFALVSCYLASALLCWADATVAALRAAPDLAGGLFQSPNVLRCVHLVALGFLAFAVAGAALHILPVMLRAGRPRARAWVALPCLWAGPLLASGIADFDERIVRPAAAVYGVGVALVLVEVGVLVVRAPRDRLLLASRAGVALSAIAVVLAFALGVRLAEEGFRPLLGIPHDRLIAIHLTLAALGWLTLLIVTVGRTLAPMLALAPSEERRRWPAVETTCAAGVAVLVAGLAADERFVTGAGGALILLSLAAFAAVVVRAGLRNRLDAPEAPLAHFAGGLLFLAQAAAAGIAVLAGSGPRTRLLECYVILLLVGWAAGVTIGHLGKLLSLSAWTWWPPGPRPKQGAFYPRRIWLGEALLFLGSLEVVAAGTLAGSRAVVTAGIAGAIADAALALAAAALTIRAGARRPAVP
jgi:hypothetical protein